MVASWARQEVTVVEPSWVDDRGTEVPNFDDPVSETDVEGCTVQPGASEEALAARQGVTIRWTVLAPPDTIVTAHSGVRYNGHLYQVDGEPLRWSSSRGRLDHVVMYLVDRQG